jgi:hypothetical protein
MSNVTFLPCVTSLDIPVEAVLEMAVAANLESCVIVGKDENGDLFFASTKADGGSVLWLFEMAKKELMEV